MAKSKKINNVIRGIEIAITQCELYCCENRKLADSAVNDLKIEYERGIDYYTARISGLKRALELIEREYK